MTDDNDRVTREAQTMLKRGINSQVGKKRRKKFRRIMRPAYKIWDPRWRMINMEGSSRLVLLKGSGSWAAQLW